MEATVANSFMELSKAIAKDFLHTAVFVDEQAFFAKKEQVTQLRSPSRTTTQMKSPSSSNLVHNTLSHDLDAKKVIDTFASQGIICSVIRPNEEELLKSQSLEEMKIVEAMKRADALILDWDLHGDKGKKALEIIHFLLSCDSKEDSRLRLMIIYSGEKNILGISEKVSTSLGNSFKPSDKFTYVKGHTRICIYAKEYAKIVDEFSDRLLKIEDFPDCLAKEVSEMTNGLVSNVALEAMSVLRKRTHQILGKLGKEIDPAYLSHRALLPNPDDAMDHLTDILASEFHSVLENNSVANRANIDTIAVYLSSKFNEDQEVKLYLKSGPDKIEEEVISIEDLIDIERNGFYLSSWLENFIKSKSPNLDGEKLEKKKIDFERKIEKSLTKTFTKDEEDSDVSDYKLSAITSLKRTNGYLEFPPILTQGTILKEANPNDKFWLCILPKCDCVRIKNERTFLFLPLIKIEGEKGFHFVIEVEKELEVEAETEVEINKYVKLKIDYSTYGLIGYNFKPTDSDDSTVRAVAENGSYYFVSGKNKFKWVCELKTSQAQRISNEFAAKLSRVGLDESEWQRRWAK